MWAVRKGIVDVPNSIQEDESANLIWFKRYKWWLISGVSLVLLVIGLMIIQQLRSNLVKDPGDTTSPEHWPEVEAIAADYVQRRLETPEKERPLEIQTGYRTIDGRVIYPWWGKHPRRSGNAHYLIAWAVRVIDYEQAYSWEVIVDALTKEVLNPRRIERIS